LKRIITYGKTRIRAKFRVEEIKVKKPLHGLPQYEKMKKTKISQPAHVPVRQTRWMIKHLKQSIAVPGMMI